MIYNPSLDPDPLARGKTRAEIDADTIKGQVQEWHYRIARGETPPAGVLEGLVAHQRQAEAIVDAERADELAQRRATKP